MRFLANENVPGPVVRRCADWVTMSYGPRKTFQGKPTASFCRLQTDQRVTVTCNTDSGLPATCGVVLLRIPWTDAITDNAFAVAMLTSRDDWTGVFAVVERDRIRIRPLPKPTSNHDTGGS